MDLLEIKQYLDLQIFGSKMRFEKLTEYRHYDDVDINSLLNRCDKEISDLAELNVALSSQFKQFFKIKLEKLNNLLDCEKSIIIDLKNELSEN